MLRTRTTPPLNPADLRHFKAKRIVGVEGNGIGIADTAFGDCDTPCVLAAPSKTDMNHDVLIRSRAFAREVFARVCISQNLPAFESTHKFKCFRPQVCARFEATCEYCDLCPIAGIEIFIELLDHELSSNPSGKIVFCVDDGRRALTSAVLLLGAYMVLKLHIPADHVPTHFSWLAPSLLEPLFLAPSPDSDLVACWRAIERARNLGWIGPAPNDAHRPAVPPRCTDDAAAWLGPEAAPGGAGTAAALRLMRAHGFAAREAVAWLRIAIAPAGPRAARVAGVADRLVLRYLSAVERLCSSYKSAAGAAAAAPRGRSAFVPCGGVGGRGYACR